MPSPTGGSPPPVPLPGEPPPFPPPVSSPSNAWSIRFPSIIPKPYLSFHLSETDGIEGVPLTSELFLRRSFTSCGSNSSSICKIIAAKPATAGVDILVPSNDTYPSSAKPPESCPGIVEVDAACSADVIPDPGATTSGFSSSHLFSSLSSTLGPELE